MREKENTTQDCALEVHLASNEIDKIICTRLGKTAVYTIRQIVILFLDKGRKSKTKYSDL